MISQLLFLSFRKAKCLNYNAEALCIMHNYTASNLYSMMNHFKRVCGYSRYGLSAFSKCNVMSIIM